MRSSMGGWVENRPANMPTEPFKLVSGLVMYRWAVALLAASRGSLSWESFSSALARPSGYLVMATADASARNSRRRDTASLIKLAIKGESSAKVNPAIMKKA